METGQKRGGRGEGRPHMGEEFREEFEAQQIMKRTYRPKR